MTQEDKELLLRDLCARLPYGVKVKIKYYDDVWELLAIYTNGTTYATRDIGYPIETYFEDCKPYLFPLSSMTEEMLEELNANGFFKYRDTIANVSHLENKNGINEEIYTYIDIECNSFLIEYFHSYHIDYKGFIEKGLAIDATDKNIY